MGHTWKNKKQHLDSSTMSVRSSLFHEMRYFACYIHTPQMRHGYPSVQRGDPMSRNPTRKEVTKRAVLAELETLRQGRHARYQTLVGRFARCPEQQSIAALFAAAIEASERTHNRTPLDAPPGWLPPVS